MRRWTVLARAFLAVLVSLTLGQGELAEVGTAASGSPWPTVAVTFSPQAPYATAMDNVAPPGCMGPGEGRCAGNASVHLTKTVTAVYLIPRLDVSLAVYKSAAIPGDTLTYTATVTNVGSALQLSGNIQARADADVAATVYAYYDVVEYLPASASGEPSDHEQGYGGGGRWIPLAGTAASLPGYTPVDPAPLATGLNLSATPVPVPGVAYPPQGDPILGTRIAPLAKAVWDYQATADLTPAQTRLILDPAQVVAVRNVVHFEVLPRNPAAAQPFTYAADFTALLRGGGSWPMGMGWKRQGARAPSPDATDVEVNLTMPDGSAARFDAATTPALADLAPGAAAAVTTDWKVPSLAPKGAGESDAAYLARLHAADGSLLTATAQATADGGGVVSPVAAASATQQLPIVTVTKSGPATSTAGSAAAYSLQLANGGSAAAWDLAVTDLVANRPAGTVSGVPTQLLPRASTTAQAVYDIPAGLPAGNLTDTAQVVWRDANANAYGPVSSSYTTVVTAVYQGAQLTLAPTAAGPDVTGTAQTLRATATDRNGDPIPDLSVTFTVSGPNAQSGSAVTDAAGVAAFSYTGTQDGTDTVRATASAGGVRLASNTASVGWVTPIQPVTTSTILGRFYESDGAGSVDVQPSQTPVITQTFPTIDFNPPAGTIPGSGNSGVTVFSRPMVDVTTDLAGNYTGGITVGNSVYQAGVGPLYTFNAIFTADFTVAQAGDVTFDFYTDDGFILGIGNGASRVGGADVNPPASGKTILEGYPVMGAYNVPTSPTGNTITVYFPQAGTYPYELDYSECCGGQLVVTMTTTAAGHGVPPTGSLSLTPFTIPTRTVGQEENLTVAAMDASGKAIADLPVVLTVTGPNQRELSATTDAAGLAAFSYVGASPGLDMAQVGASIDGMPAISNLVDIPWAEPPTGPPPLISGISPADGTTVTVPMQVYATFTPPAGQSIVSWSVSYQREGSNTDPVLAQGSGPPPAVLGTFDPTVLPDGTYLLTVSAAASGGGTQSQTVSLVVDGQLKLGRYVMTYQDLSVPVNGLQMQVLRTYDSTDKSVGDFGVGWHVSLADFRVETNGPLGQGGWTQYDESCAIGLCLTGFRTAVPHYVTVTWPDGRQDVFDFTPAGGTNVFWTGTAAFTPRPGTVDTLAVYGDAGLTYDGDGNLYGANGVFNPQEFQLTTPAGQVFLLSVATGLVSETDRNGNSLTVSPSGITASNGESIAFTRDAQGRITQVTGPSGQTLSYTYDAAGDLQSVRDPDGNVTTYSYDQNHDLLSATGPDGKPLVTLTYDSSGRLTSITDADGNTTTVQNDVGTRQQTVTDPNGQLTTVYSYDSYGDLLRKDQLFDGTDRVTTYTYDANHRIVSETDPLGHTIYAAYDQNGDLTQFTDQNGHVTRFTYNAYGEPTSEVAPDGTTVATLSYDSHGNLIAEQRADGSAYTFTYDAAGHVTSVTDPLGRTAKMTYDAAGHLSSVTDPAGDVYRQTVDASGRITSVTDALGDTTTFSYDPEGHLTSFTDANGHTWTYAYDALGDLTSMTDPLGHTATYAYDAAGHLTSRTTRDGQTVTYAYDADGRLTSETLPDGEVNTYGYDPLGELTSADNEYGTIALAYDADGRIVSQTTTGSVYAPQPTVTLSYTYDPAGNRLSMTGPEGTTGYAYNPDGLLTSLTDPSGGSFNFGYDALERLTSITRPNGVDDLLQYDQAGELTSRVASLGSTTLAESRYAYDPTGRRTSRTGLAGTSTYTYDAAGRLTGATYPAASGLTDATYTYDPVGNRTNADGVPYAYDAADRLTSDGTYTYAYDNSGNLTSRTDVATGAVTSFDWNAQHQLLAVHYPDGATTTYAYDALGRRIGVDAAGQTTGYVYDGANIHLEYDGGSLAAVYTTGLSADSALEMTRGGQSYYYLQDGLGSTTALTDAAGAVVDAYRYDAFGNPVSTGTVENPFTFTGREYDGEDGIYYYRARYYDPGVGRFLSEDPLFAFNPYSYANNDPVDYVDPSGAQAIDEYATLTEQDEAQAASEEEIGQQVVKDSTQVLERHHLLPKQFIDKFRQVGLDVEDYTVRISRAMHRLKPGGLHTGTNSWNARWADFFRRNPRYSAEDVLKYLDELKKEFGLL